MTETKTDKIQTINGPIPSYEEVKKNFNNFIGKVAEILTSTFPNIKNKDEKQLIKKYTEELRILLKTLNNATSLNKEDKKRLKDFLSVINKTKHQYESSNCEIGFQFFYELFKYLLKINDPRIKDALIKFVNTEKDALTGLYNRGFFNATLNNILLNKREVIPHTVFLLDIDNFKSINDNYGHNEGDEVLKNLSIQLRQSVRDTDIVCRYGGEEFAIICSGLNEEKAKEKAEQILKTIRNNKISKYTYVTISIGSITFNTGVDNGIKTIDDITNKADKALYEAKHTGKDKYISYDEIEENQINSFTKGINDIDMCYHKYIDEIFVNNDNSKIKNILDIDITNIFNIEQLDSLQVVYEYILRKYKHKKIEKEFKNKETIVKERIIKIKTIKEIYNNNPKIKQTYPDIDHFIKNNIK